MSNSPILCDSCLRPASPEHIHDRLARLELATRYRPIHINLLLVCAAPPANPADDLYAWEKQGASDEARKFITALMQIFAVNPELSPAEQMAELQHQGIYLARLVECPLANQSQFNSLTVELGPTLIKRITYSYKPKRIALINPIPPGLPETLKAAGLADRLLSNGRGIDIPSPDDSAAIARLRSIVSTNI